MMEADISSIAEGEQWSPPHSIYTWKINFKKPLLFFSEKIFYVLINIIKTVLIKQELESGLSFSICVSYCQDPCEPTALFKYNWPSVKRIKEWDIGLLTIGKR